MSLIFELGAMAIAAGCGFNALQTKRRLNGRLSDEKIEALCRAVRLRSPRMAMITDRAIELSGLAAKRLNLEFGDIYIMNRAIALRDLGLCSVSYQLLNDKPFDQWEQSDRDALRVHLGTTDELLSNMPTYSLERDLLRQSESIFWLRDGSARPQISALILKTCCDYSFMERTVGVEAAEQHLISQSGREYEPGVVNAVLEVLHSHRVRAVESVS